MTDLIRTILSSPAGSFGFIFGIIILAGWLIHWATKHITTINSNHTALNNNVNKMDNNIDEIRKDIAYLRGSVEIIKSNSEPLTKRKSPISLTTLGLEIAEKVKASQKISLNWDKIYRSLEEDVKDKNPYDTQEFIMETIAVEPEVFFDKETLSELKDFAFKHGNVWQYYSGMFGVLIRDRYLEEKGIDVSEVDASDPSKQNSETPIV
ncbi:MAG: hypothetical protein ACK5L7_10240 [Paludibacteraceae bacterium]